MADVIIQIYGIRTVEDARMVVEMGGSITLECLMERSRRTPGQLSCERAEKFLKACSRKQSGLV